MIPISRPFMDQREAQAASEVLQSGWVTQGPQVAAFEAEFAAAVGAAQAVAVSSGTAALHLALLEVGVRPGDEVVTVSHSFIATANAVRYCQAIPVFADIEAEGFNIDPGAVEALITPKTSAILCVHQLGMPCDLAALGQIAVAHELPLVEDAACAVGSEWRNDEGGWERVGRPHGDIACFSFHPRKVITTGDGGMLTTDSAEAATRLRRWRQHGMSLPDTARHGAATIAFECYEEVAFNYRMTDIQAAVGRVQLQRLPDMIARRRQLAERYATALSDVRGLTLPREPDWARSNWQSYCTLLEPSIDQRAVMQGLRDRGIATKRGVSCAHLEPAYAAAPWRGGPLEHSEQAMNRGLMLPLFDQLSDAEQEQVIDALCAELSEIQF